jgi:hypothetical protein
VAVVFRTGNRGPLATAMTVASLARKHRSFGADAGSERWRLSQHSGTVKEII